MYQHSPILTRMAHPLEARRKSDSIAYVYGKTATREVVPNILPLVSSFVEWDLDGQFNTVYRVTTKYCYNHREPVESREWHQFGEQEWCGTIKEAVKLAEGQGRGAFAHAITLAVAQDVHKAMNS